MFKAYILDTETNGLLPELDTIHSIVLRDIESGEVVADCADDPGYTPLATGLEMIREADLIVGHNVLTFDLPALAKVYPDFALKSSCVVRDTLVLSRLLWPDIKEDDFRLRKRRPEFPGQMIGRHSLESWGHRLVALGLGALKGKYTGGWKTWSAELQAYCGQDTRVTLDLWNLILSKQPAWSAVELEHQVQVIVDRQVHNGFGFDKVAAIKLYTILAKRTDELERELRAVFLPWWAPGKTMTPKRDNKRMGYTAGAELTKASLVEFNPGSRHHITDRLKKLRGWRPAEFTPDGRAKVDETILENLPYPEAKLLSEYLMVGKRLGQVADGKEAWLKHERDGRIYGGVITIGCVTSRMSHSKPNVAQVPAPHSPYGPECRECWIPRAGWWLVGADASGLEARDLAGYMSRWDGGDFIKVVLEGNKDDGTDLHSMTMRALATWGVDRDTSKTWFYAWLYGAGNLKLGLILGVRGSRQKLARAGMGSRQDVESSIPALGALVKAVKKKSAQRGYLVGLDGRHVPVRYAHAALNTLLQSAGAIQMKRALVILDQALQHPGGLIPTKDYEFCANVHDEWQLECRTQEIAHYVGRAACVAIRAAGEFYRFPCPLGGEYKVGRNWAETH